LKSRTFSENEEHKINEKIMKKIKNESHPISNLNTGSNFYDADYEKRTIDFRTEKLKEKYKLEFNPMLMDITRIIAIGKKEITFSGKMTIKRGDICMCCGRTLTDEFSMLSKLGKTCAKHMRINYIKNVNEVERFRDEYMKRVEEIGEMEFVVPKKQIKRWDGPMLFIVNQLHKR
jgi:hypothetical protein